MAEVIINKFVVEFHQYPNGGVYTKMYPIGKPMVKASKQKKVIPDSERLSEVVSL